MKLLILLAFLATANAAVYSGCSYSYSYFQRCNWYVPLPSTCWQFRVHYCQQWYTTKYYAPILKVYPSDSCGEPGWKEMTEQEFTDDCAGKLAERRELIREEIVKHFNEFVDILNATINSYKAKQREYLNKYYENLIACAQDAAAKEKLENERDDYCAKYATMLLERATAVYNAYLAAILKRLESLDEFHKKILDASVKCYKDRMAKIEEYKKQLDERISQYYIKYKNTMYDLTIKRMDAYKKLLFKIHGSETWAVDQINTVLNYFYWKEYYKCLANANTYYEKLLALKDKLVSNYTCYYRCITYSGCLNFYRRQYYGTCKRLGAWWSYKITTHGCFRYINYKFSWRTCEYKDLKTCDPTTVNQTAEQFRASIQPQVDEAIAATKKALEEWKAKWEKLHAEYASKYMEIISKRHEFLLAAKKASLLCYYCSWTAQAQAEYDTCKQDLEARLVQCYNDFVRRLKEQREKAISDFETRITAYAARLQEFVDKVVERYQLCLDTRTKKIEEYRVCQTEIMKKLRMSLEKKLNDIVDLKVKYYTELLSFYHCGYLGGAVGDLLALYKSKVEAEARDVLAEFDAFWATRITKLVEHYACCYKCKSTVRICVPTFTCGSYYNWKVCFPRTTCYSYKYTYYKKYCNYRLTYCNRRYVWSCK